MRSAFQAKAFRPTLAGTLLAFIPRKLAYTDLQSNVPIFELDYHYD
jgi:hypothetical protein